MQRVNPTMYRQAHNRAQLNYNVFKFNYLSGPNAVLCIQSTWPSDIRLEVYAPLFSLSLSLVVVGGDPLRLHEWIICVPFCYHGWIYSETSHCSMQISARHAMKTSWAEIFRPIMSIWTCASGSLILHATDACTVSPNNNQFTAVARHPRSTSTFERD